MMLIAARGISRGTGSGILLVSSAPISFLSGVDPESGIVIEKGHPLEGQCIAGRVLAFDHGKGSTVGSYVIYALRRNGKAPAAIINVLADPIIAVGAIISGIPMVDRPEVDIRRLRTGTHVLVDGTKGELEYGGELLPEPHP
jgi:phosphomecalonate degydratase small subunit